MSAPYYYAMSPVSVDPRPSGFDDDDNNDGLLDQTDHYGDRSHLPQQQQSQPQHHPHQLQPEQSARQLVTEAKTTLSQFGAMKHLKRSLRRKMHVLQERKVYKRGMRDGNLEEIVVDGWINELLRFLALKTLVGDTVKPFQIVPGEPIAVAWEALLVMPSYYASVCRAMGNDFVIDHDPFDFTTDAEESRRRIKKYNATLRLYQQFFDEQAPHLYWKEPSLEKSAVTIFLESVLLRLNCAGKFSNC